MVVGGEVKRGRSGGEGGYTEVAGWKDFYGCDMKWWLFLNKWVQVFLKRLQSQG